MQISDIKSRLTLQTVLNHYNIKLDSSGRSLCPWHDDKVPSLQIYHNTNSWTCFSSNCSAGSGDQIDMIRLNEKCTPHQAILKAKEMSGHQIIVAKTIQVKEVSIDDTAKDGTSRIKLLSRAFNTYVNALQQMKSAVVYLENRKLWRGFAGKTPLDMGYNGGRFHFRGKLTEAEKQLWKEMKMIKSLGAKGYRSWAKDCVIFPLKNNKNCIVSFYGRSIINDDDQRHYYMSNRAGLYPRYPSSITKQLVLTESVIDAASLIMASVMTEEISVLACYGTNGLTAEHVEAIKALPHLTELIFFFDGDQAGIKAIDKYCKQLTGIKKNLIISKVNTPQGEDVNSMHVGHEATVFQHLLENRTVLIMADGVESELFSFNGKDKGDIKPKELKSQLHIDHPDHLMYQTEAIKIHIWGGIESNNLGKLKVSLHIERKDKRGKSFRDEVNLYSFSQVKRITNHIGESLDISSNYVSEFISDLTVKLEAYRLSQKGSPAKDKRDEKKYMTAEQNKAAIQLLSSPKLMRKTLDLIVKSGLVGQHKNGLLLFLLYLSRYFDEPLHAIIFGKSGSGKTYLQTKISDCIPPEDLRVVTSLTENTLYYSPKGFWKHKVLLIEDLEGVYQAFLPLREMMSKQEISKLTTDKDSQGNNVQVNLKVEGPICVSGATTKEWIYEDNANRSYLFIIDESKDHLKLVMAYQRKQYAGQINQQEQDVCKESLQNGQRLLKKNIQIINPYAEQLILPEQVFKKLRTNMHYLKLIQIITFYCQYSRVAKTNRSGGKYIETSIEDIEWANRLVKESLLQKSDELSGKLRQFFEIIKELMRTKKENEQSFYAKQIRQYLRMNPMTVNRHLRRLEMRGYIRQIGGNQKIGYEYEIELWNDYKELQKGIAKMDENLKKIKDRVTKKELARQA